MIFLQLIDFHLLTDASVGCICSLHDLFEGNMVVIQLVFGIYFFW